MPVGIHPSVWLLVAGPDPDPSVQSVAPLGGQLGAGAGGASRSCHALCYLKQANVTKGLVTFCV